MTNKATMTTLRAQIAMLSASMDDLGIDRVTVSDLGHYVKIGYAEFVETFGYRTDFQRLGSEIRCVDGDITFCSEVVKDHEAKAAGGEPI